MAGSPGSTLGIVRIALAGVGRMGAAIAGRLRSAGHRLTLYDPLLTPGGEAAPSLAAAASRSAITFLCLPDAAAVEASLPGLREAAPPTVIDMTSSLPATTRRMAADLAPLGVDYLDCPLSGGVAGARAGTLTAMAGGDEELVEQVAPVLTAFASYIRWAGPLGSGHAVKALNNALSAVSLTGTAEMLVTAAAYGAEEAAVIEAFNRGGARSQNSEVKYPRDVLPRTYDSGFTAGLMEKDIGNAIHIAADRSIQVPLLAGASDAWREATALMGADTDYTRVHEVIAARGGAPESSDGFSLDMLESALASVNLLAASEVMRVASAEGLDRDRVLALINTSSGRSEATRSHLAGEIDAAALAAARDLAGRAGVWAPLTTLAAELAGATLPGGKRL